MRLRACWLLVSVRDTQLSLTNLKRNSNPTPHTDSGLCLVDFGYFLLPNAASVASLAAGFWPNLLKKNAALVLFGWFLLASLTSRRHFDTRIFRHTRVFQYFFWLSSEYLNISFGFDLLVCVCVCVSVCPCTL